MTICIDADTATLMFQKPLVKDDGDGDGQPEVLGWFLMSFARYNRQCPSLRTLEVTPLTQELHDRPLVEKLFDFIDEEAETLDINNQVIVTTEEIEIINAWLDCAPCVKYVAAPVRKRKPPTGRSVDDSGISSTYHGMQEANKSYKEIYSYKLWKQCVEPNTFHYIPDNGTYRTAKIVRKPSGVEIPRYVYLHHQRRAAMQNERYITAEQKQRQRDIQKELRKEIEHDRIQERLFEEEKNRMMLDATKDETERDGSVTESDKDSLIGPTENQMQAGPERVALDDKEMVRNDSPSIDSMEIVAQKCTTKVEHIPRQTTNQKKSKYFQRVRTPVELPPIDVPLLGMSTNHKNNSNGSDNEASPLQRRISALEEEMKNDFYILRKGQDDHFVYVSSERSQSEPPLGRSRFVEYNKAASSPYKDALVDTMISVKPIRRKKKSNKTARASSEFHAVRSQFKHKTSTTDIVRTVKNAGSAPPTVGGIQRTEAGAKHPLLSRGTDRSSVSRGGERANSRDATPQDKLKPKLKDGSTNPTLSRENSLLGGYLRGDSTLGMTRENSTLLNGSDHLNYDLSCANKRQSVMQGNKLITQGNLRVSTAGPMPVATGKLLTAEHLHLVRKSHLRTDEPLADGLLPEISGKRLQVLMASQRLGLN